MKLHDLRQQYGKESLDESTCPADPMVLVKEWIEKAIEFHAFEANAFVLSTTSHGRSSSRVVLLKEITENGFVFFSNYKSKKGIEIETNPIASMLFFWPDMERQLRIEGALTKIPASESDVYFDSRPLDSRLSAVVSPQSNVIESMEDLMKARNELLKQSDNVKRPAGWGGYVLTPDYYEFWQGGAHRLHDRIAYKLKNGEWLKVRLAP